MVNKTANVTIIIPVYNEEEAVPLMVESLTSAFDGVNYSVLFVDDGSGDGTWTAIMEAAKKNTSVAGLRFSRNFGKESGVFAGLDNADGDCVIVMDGDLQHPPSTARAMYDLWAKAPAENKIIEAVKIRRQDESAVNRLFARLFYFLLRFFSGISLSNMSDFKLLDKDVVNAMRQMPERYTFFRAMASWTGYATNRIAFEAAPRITGKTKFKPWALAKLAVYSISTYSSAPLQLVTLVGIVFVVFAVALSIHTLYMKLAGFSVEGFATVILLLLLIGGILMMSLGIIGVYIAKIYNEVKMRPRYIISTRTDNGDYADMEG